MPLTITDEIRQALRDHPGEPIALEDDQTQARYVLVPLAQFQKLQEAHYDDSELTPEEMLAAAALTLDEEDDWGAADDRDQSKDGA